MSYLVLARKWRPQDFQDVVGQKPIVRTLQNALKSNRVAHAMIFSGVRGVGKTTLARIMAKAINCSDSEKRPCNQCDSCLSITKGTAIDLHEIDGASNRGIQEIRDLKENIRFLPAQERYKVIIIDEVHMLTAEAFNALLKTLEEPPDHVFFMFATTELHKVPVTILSRCQRYELKRVPFSELVTFFAKIANHEGVEISTPALEIIATEADGSVRDGLSLLDQIFAFGGEKISEDDLHEVLGLVDRRIFIKLGKTLLESDLAEGLQLLNHAYNQGVDLKRFSHGLLFYFRSLLICKTSKMPSEILDISDHDMSSLKEVAAKHSTETFTNILNILVKGIEDMQYSSNPRMVLEMTFVKATQLGEIVPITSILTRLDKIIAISAGQKPADIQQQSTTPQPEIQPPVENQNATIVSEKKKVESDNLACSEEPVVVSESTVPENVHSPVIKTKSKDVHRDWDGFLKHVKDRKPWMASTLNLSDKSIEKNGELIIKFDEPSECLYLQESANMTLLTEFAQDFFQKDLTVKIAARGGEGADGHNQPQAERRALANDPRVLMTTEILGGQVSGIRTGPRSR